MYLRFAPFLHTDMAQVITHVRHEPAYSTLDNIICADVLATQEVTMFNSVLILQLICDLRVTIFDDDVTHCTI